MLQEQRIERQPEDQIVRLAEPHRQLNSQTRQVCYAHITALVGKTWNSKIINGNIWKVEPEDVDSLVPWTTRAAQVTHLSLIRTIWIVLQKPLAQGAKNVLIRNFPPLLTAQHNPTGDMLAKRLSIRKALLTSWYVPVEAGKIFWMLSA